MIINILLLVLMAPLVLAFAYHGILVATAFWPRRVPKYSASTNKHRFAILVPAHNEAAGIEATIRNLDQELDYPRDQYEIFVIADNCTDNTAEISRRFDVECLERLDRENRGKGWALDWAFKSLLAKRFDVFVVIDADCYLDSHALQALDDAYDGGAKVVQLNDVADNPDASPISYASVVANYLENEFYNVPKDALGLAIFLRGTGMSFHRSVLEEIPWNASSLAEDLEYSVNLIRNNIRTKYLKNAAVYSEFPIDSKTFEVQRERWSGGGTSITKKSFVSLILEGLMKRNLLLVDAAFSLWLQARALIIVYATSLFLASFANLIWNHSPFAIFCFAISMTCILLLVAYGLIGIAVVGVTAYRIRFLIELPAIATKWLVISIRTWLPWGSKSSEWMRSPRSLDERQ